LAGKMSTCIDLRRFY